jgi:hypothetical protein
MCKHSGIKIIDTWMLFSLLLPFLDILIQTWTNACLHSMNKDLGRPAAADRGRGGNADRKGSKAGRVRKPQLKSGHDSLDVVVGSQTIAVSQQRKNFLPEEDEVEENSLR